MALIGSAGWLLVTTPQGFIPAQDRGYVIVSAQLPGAASLTRTTAVVREIERIALDTPGIVRVAAFAGLSGATRTQASNAAALFPVFEEPEVRLKKGLTAAVITDDLRKRLLGHRGRLHHRDPAALGARHRHRRRLRHADPGPPGPRTANCWRRATDELVNAARKAPGLTSVFSPFTANTPQVFVDIDRIKAQKLGVPIQNVTDTIETYFGSTYVNDFNILGRTYHVTAQADLPFRKETADLARLRTRNAAGDMVLLGSVVDFKDISGPDRVARYNLYPASELQGETLPGTSSATAIDDHEEAGGRDAAERLLLRMDRSVLSAGHRRQCRGSTCFRSACCSSILVLAAQYGSWTLPFAVILIVPMCLLAATIGVRIMGQDINILTQIGFVVLVGLAAKNAILIVEFARDIEKEGRDRLDAVIEACRLRLRPILMTSFAFILGVLPLVVSTGAGSEMRQAVGVAVFFGMLGVTLFGLIFTPIFYVVVRNLAEGPSAARLRRLRRSGKRQCGLSALSMVASRVPSAFVGRRAAASRPVLRGCRACRSTAPDRCLRRYPGRCATLMRVMSSRRSLWWIASVADVEMRRALVEKQHPGSAIERAGEQHALLLAARERAAHVADQAVVAHRHLP